MCVFVTGWLFKSNWSIDPVSPGLYDLDVSGFHHYHNRSPLTTGSLSCYSEVIIMRHNVMFGEGKGFYFHLIIILLKYSPRRLIYDVCISVTKFVAHYWSRLAGCPRLTPGPETDQPWRRGSDDSHLGRSSLFLISSSADSGVKCQSVLMLL